MQHDYREGMSVWAWLPDLKEEIAGVVSDERGWYPAEVAAVDEANGLLCLSFDAGDEGEASVMFPLEAATVRIYPHPDPPPDEYVAGLFVRLWRALGEAGADDGPGKRS